MRVIHIIQAGDDNGDIQTLRKAAKRGNRIRRWTAPKNVAVGDAAILYVQTLGFFATAEIASLGAPSVQRERRYDADINRVRLIEPPISLATLRKKIPQLDWARYPRSITTVQDDLVDAVIGVIRERRRGVMHSFVDEKSVEEASVEELEALAYASVRSTVPGVRRETIHRLRCDAIARYVKVLADGKCEGCGNPAPFKTLSGEPYLETHHVQGLAKEGSDHPANVAALCPNCHRRAEHSIDRVRFNRMLLQKLRTRKRIRG